MGDVQAIAAVLHDAALAGTAKRARIFELLSEEPERGVSVATGYLVGTDDKAGAGYVAQYLELVPGAHAEKTRAAERLLQEGGELARVVSWLVAWLPEELLDKVIAEYLADPEPEKSPLGDVLYCIALFRPDLLRPHADRLKDDVQRGLLSGAPDELVDAFLEVWHETRDLAQLEAIALIRTDRAREQLRALRDTVEDPADWDVVMQLAGTLVDSGRPAGFRPASMAFVVDKGETPHLLGGTFDGEVPICFDCEEPAERFLKLSATALPFELTNDPSFFWFTCVCEAMDSSTVRITPDGQTTVYFGPSSAADDSRNFVPGEERSLALEPHPNQLGISLEAVFGNSAWQVGGLPQWSEIDRHPRCPECGHSMPFIVSMTGDLTPYGLLSLDGCLYGFWCDDCCVSSVTYQVD